MGLPYVCCALVDEAAHAVTLRPEGAAVVVLQPGGAVVTLQPGAGTEGVGAGEMERLRKVTSATATPGGTRGVPDGDMIEVRRTGAGTLEKKLAILLLGGQVLSPLMVEDLDAKQAQEKWIPE